MWCKASLVSLIVAALSGLAGCPQPPGTTTTLTDDQKAAMQSVVKQLAGASSVLGTCASLANSQLNLDNIGQAGSFGDCPAVVFLTNSSFAIIQINFGTGCSGTATGGQTVSGEVNISVTRATRSATIQFNNLTIDGKTISGSLTVTIQAAASGVSLTGSCNITITGVGTITGQFTLTISSTGQISLTAPALSLNDGTATYAVALANVSANPAGNNSFVPSSGTATFALANATTGTADTVVVTFTSQTPASGTVQVSVNGGAPVNYQVPGVAG